MLAYQAGVGAAWSRKPTQFGPSRSRTSGAGRRISDFWSRSHPKSGGSALLWGRSVTISKNMWGSTEVLPGENRWGNYGTLWKYVRRSVTISENTWERYLCYLVKIRSKVMLPCENNRVKYILPRKNTCESWITLWNYVGKLCYLVKIRGEGQLRVQVIDERPVIRPVDEDDMIVPDDESLLFSARLLTPQRHHPLLVGYKDRVGLVQLGRWRVEKDCLAQLVHILLAVAGRVRTL